jgi:hypothetical protein
VLQQIFFIGITVILKDHDALNLSLDLALDLGLSELRFRPFFHASPHPGYHSLLEVAKDLLFGLEESEQVHLAVLDSEVDYLSAEDHYKN